ncbi:protealysin inhibitor emfourin [Rhizobium paknamense]|uniref:Uncharacterized protein n=1 Tax=Rhizobium paknamense TaxID=1206817 RepID=A0ABU0I7E6_9HYPH|nr:protealysin inhibitor emfourin [Rhizobium paknamense]MDQ0454150.1 hypothetical protein [Rhizobium paknamense]
MGDLHLEKLGGFAGFGGAGAKLKCCGVYAAEQLDDAERSLIETFFEGNPLATRSMDGFRYRITWPERFGERSVEVSENLVPEALRKAVKDRLL